MLVRAILSFFVVLCIVGLVGALAWSVTGVALDGLETRRIEASAVAESTRTEQVQVEATRTATLGEQQVELVRAEAQIIKQQAALVTAQAIADTVTANSEILRDTFDQMTKTITSQQRQMSRGNTIEKIWARGNGILTVLAIFGAYILGKQKND